MCTVFRMYPPLLNAFVVVRHRSGVEHAICGLRANIMLNREARQSSSGVLQVSIGYYQWDRPTHLLHTSSVQKYFRFGSD